MDFLTLAFLALAAYAAVDGIRSWKTPPREAEDERAKREADEWWNGLAEAAERLPEPQRRKFAEELDRFEREGRKAVERMRRTRGQS